MNHYQSSHHAHTLYTHKTAANIIRHGKALWQQERGCLCGCECEIFGSSRCFCEYSKPFPEHPVPDAPISPISGRIAAERNYRTQSHASAPAPELLLLVPSRTASFTVLYAYQASYLYNLWLHFQRCLYVTVTGAASSGAEPLLIYRCELT